MPRYLLWLLLPWLLPTQAANEQPKPYDVDEAYDIFSTVLAMEKQKDDTLLIGDTTVPFNLCLEKRSDKLADSAIEDYKKTNNSRWRLQHRFNLDHPYQLMAADQQRHRSKRATIEAKGIYHFSAIGFSPDKSIAFVEMDFVCGGLCGHGRPYILQKKDGKWELYDFRWTKRTQLPVICSWAY